MRVAHACGALAAHLALSKHSRNIRIIDNCEHSYHPRLRGDLLEFYLSPVPWKTVKVKGTPLTLLCTRKQLTAESPFPWDFGMPSVPPCSPVKGQSQTPNSHSLPYR